MADKSGDTKKGSVLASIFKAIGGLSANEITQIANDLDAVSKGAPHSVDLTTGEEVKDHWMEGEDHKVPTAKEIVTGPAQSASGSGAPKMIREYASPAKQEGITAEAERLGAELNEMHGVMKALRRDVAIVAKGQSALLTILAKASEEDDEDEDESEMVEKAAAKARRLFAKAKAKLQKAAECMDEAEDEEGEARKAKRMEARAFRKAAAKLIVKARVAALISKSQSGDVRKSISELLKSNSALKADIDIVKGEEEDDEEETAKAASAVVTTPDVAVVAAKSDEKGNQADKQDPATGNQDDAALKSKVELLADQVKKAVDGVSMLSGNVNDMMDLISNKSTSGAAPAVDSAALMKGDPDTVVAALLETIEDQLDAGTLDERHAGAARNVASKLSAVMKGNISQSTFDDYLKQAPAAIQLLIKNISIAKAA